MLFLLCGTINQKGETESQLQTESQLNVKPESDSNPFMEVVVSKPLIGVGGGCGAQRRELNGDPD